METNDNIPKDATPTERFICEMIAKKPKFFDVPAMVFTFLSTTRKTFSNDNVVRLSMYIAFGMGMLAGKKFWIEKIFENLDKVIEVYDEVSTNVRP